MAASDYISSSDLKDALSLTGETFADTVLARAVTAASRAVDDVTDRRFYPDDDANQVRYYSPVDDCRVWIDDLITLTAFETDPGGDGTFQDSWTEVRDFYLEPFNAPADNEPYRSIRVSPRTALYLPVFYPRSVKVTGKFGWSAVPAGIAQATGMIAAKLVKRIREAPFGVIAGLVADTSVAVQVTRQDPDIMGLLNGFRRDWEL